MSAGLKSVPKRTEYLRPLLLGDAITAIIPIIGPMLWCPQSKEEVPTATALKPREALHRMYTA